jgi:hypothetical protein
MSIVASASVTASYANNGTITLTVTRNPDAGILTYMWNDGNTDKDRTGLTEGDYYVSITNTNGMNVESTSLYINVPTTFWLYLLRVQCCFQKMVKCALEYEKEGRYDDAKDKKATAHIVWDILRILKCYQLGVSGQCLTVFQVKTLIDKLNKCGCPPLITLFTSESFLLQENLDYLLQQDEFRIRL